MESNLFSSRPSKVKISLSALSHNFQTIKGLVTPSEVLCVVKANAFGHGIIECSHTLEKCGAKWFGVALVEEGILLRQSGIKGRILVFGGIYNAQVDQYIANDLELTASSTFKLKQIDEIASQMKKKAKLHLEFDSGMGRIGVRVESADDLIQAAKNCPWCEIVGAYSHFSSADDPDAEEFTAQQLSKFSNVVAKMKAAFGSSTICHMSNSAGITSKPDAQFDLVRPGLLLYGVNPNSALTNLDLKPVLSLNTKVVYVKTVPANTPISYGRTWTSQKESRILTLPIGYGDGYFRALSNKASVLINGKRYPIVGRVCMDQMMVDVGNDTVFNGDDVVLLGSQGKEEITVQELADLAGTISYEIFTMLNNRLPRQFY
jgi:alanine racemase